MGMTDSGIRSAEAMLKTLEYDLKMLQPILDDDPVTRPLSQAWRGNTVRAAMVAKLWRAEGRQTLVMHPEVVRECAQARSTKIPTDVLRAIPYLNPMVVFAEPVKIPTWRNTSVSSRWMDYGDSEIEMRMVGFMCYGQHDTVAWIEEVRRNGIPTSTHSEAIALMVRQPGLTHDADIERFGMLVVCEVLDSKGKVLDVDTATFSVGFGENMTMDEMVESQLERFAFSGVDDPEKGRAYISAAYRTVLGTLMYLASTTLDAEKVPASVTRPLSKRTIARKPLSLYRVGWTVGAALTAMRRERLSLGRESQMGDLRHQQDPQHRRAHFKVVWCGPGRSIPKTAYISPYWTHRERLGLTGVNTVRTVPKAKA